MESQLSAFITTELTIFGRIGTLFRQWPCGEFCLDKIASFCYKATFCDYFSDSHQRSKPLFGCYCCCSTFRKCALSVSDWSFQGCNIVFTAWHVYFYHMQTRGRGREILKEWWKPEWRKEEVSILLSDQKTSLSFPIASVGSLWILMKWWSKWSFYFTKLMHNHPMSPNHFMHFCLIRK